MNMEKLVEDYIDAWNRQDVAGILELMHKGAAYYDAFWTETCVGRELDQYLKGYFDEEPYWYQQVGDAIVSDRSVVFRYSAHERSDSKIGNPIFYGAEVLIVRGSKILTVSDYYCDPDPSALEEIAELAAKRHGVPSHTKAGLGELKMLRFKSKLSEAILQDKIYRDPNLTLSELADRIGCSVDQLSVVINSKFGTDFHTFLDSHRVKYARALLQDVSDEPNYVAQVATKAGFQSFKDFDDSFRQSFGVTPTEYYSHQDKHGDSVHKPFSH